MILGVCEKLGQQTNVNPWVFRLLFLFFGLSWTGVIVYIIIAFIND